MLHAPPQLAHYRGRPLEVIHDQSYRIATRIVPRRTVEAVPGPLFLKVSTKGKHLEGLGIRTGIGTKGLASDGELFRQGRLGSNIGNPTVRSHAIHPVTRHLIKILHRQALQKGNEVVAGHAEQFVRIQLDHPIAIVHSGGGALLELFGKILLRRKVAVPSAHVGNAEARRQQPVGHSQTGSVLLGMMQDNQHVTRVEAEIQVVLNGMGQEGLIVFGREGDLGPHAGRGLQVDSSGTVGFCVGGVDNDGRW
mmetsp:Transcript_13685/g.37828  ORF Transcript_13685/g.37828 Transcript_13685/m.37828 type:complete len:251 (+) Transcript_13685:736-1488(+)